MVEITSEVLAALGRLDTPTVCNALELVAPERRGWGYSVEPLVCARPDLPPIVGFARTARIRAQHPADDDAAANARRDDYFRYVDDGPKPSVMVLQDLDGDSRGYGSWWGEVNSAIHLGLGATGVVTDGSIRDLPDIADGFQLLAGRVGPSHAFVQMVDFGGPVNVAGMGVVDGDLIHADQHGAVVIPTAVAADVPAAADLIARREAVIIEAAKEPGFDHRHLLDARRRASEIER